MSPSITAGIHSLLKEERFLSLVIVLSCLDKNRFRFYGC